MNEIRLPLTVWKLMLKADKPALHALYSAVWAAGYTVNDMPA